MLEHGFRKYEIIKLLNNIKKRIKRVEENVPTQIDDAINQLLDGAPQALDTLKELANALGNNPDIITELNNKIDSIDIKKDWNQNDENADDYIENRTHYKENSEYIFYSDESFNNQLTIDEAVERLESSSNMGNGIYFKYKRIRVADNTVVSSEIGQFYVLFGINRLLFAYKTGSGYNIVSNKYSSGYKNLDILNRADITKETLINWIKNNVDGYDISGNNGNIIANLEKSEEVYHKLDKEYLYTPDWNQSNEEDGSFIKNKTHWFEKGECIFYTQYYNGSSTPRESIDDIIDRLFTSIENEPNENIISTNSYFGIEITGINTIDDLNKGKLYVVYRRDRGTITIDGSLKFGNSEQSISRFTNKEEIIGVDTNKLTKNDIHEAINEFIKEVEEGNIYNNSNTQYHCVKEEDIYHKLDSNYLPDNVNDSIMLKESSIPSEGLEANKFYELGEISQDTTFTLKAPTNNNISNKYIVQFSIGTTIPNITWPSNIKWENGSVPTINADKIYLLEIINDLAQIKEF